MYPTNDQWVVGYNGFYVSALVTESHLFVIVGIGIIRLYNDRSVVGYNGFYVSAEVTESNPFVIVPIGIIRL